MQPAASWLLASRQEEKKKEEEEIILFFFISIIYHHHYFLYFIKLHSHMLHPGRVDMDFDQGIQNKQFRDLPLSTFLKYRNAKFCKEKECRTKKKGKEACEH